MTRLVSSIRFQLASALAISLAAVLLASASARADTFDVGPQDDLFAVLGALSAGDEVVVQAGTYQTPGFLEVTWAGTAEAPIAIRAAEGARPIIAGDPSQNVINIDGSHFSLRGFEITGGSHGLRLGDVSDATFADLVIHDIEDVALSCNRPGHTCDAVRIEGVEIYNTGRSGTGEGMYLGCNDGACEFRNSHIVGNYLHDLDGSQADGIEIKTGAHGNTVRDNVIVGARYPAITMYGFADGAGADNLVEGNFVWGTEDNGIQVVGQVVVRNNIVIDAGGNGIHSKSSQGFWPDSVHIVHNTVLSAGAACLKTNDWSDAVQQVVANNALYCEQGLAVDINGGAPDAVLVGNVVAGEIRAPAGFQESPGARADFLDIDDLGLYPASDGSALRDAGDPAYAALDDFNGQARASGGLPDVGAYEAIESDNPGWQLQSGFKEAAADVVEEPTGGCQCRAVGSPAGARAWSPLALFSGLLMGLCWWTRKREGGR